MFKKIFWSVMLILFGTLILLKNLAIISFCWSDFLFLWPFLIILIGVSILPLSDKYKALIAIIAIAAAVATFFIADKSNKRHGCSWSWSNGNSNYDWRYNDDDNDDDNDESDYKYDYKYDDGQSQQKEEEYQSDSNKVVKSSTSVIIKNNNNSNKDLCEDYNPDIQIVDFDMALAAGLFNISGNDNNKLMCFHNENNYLNYSLKSKDIPNGIELSLELENQETKTLDTLSKYYIGLNQLPSWNLDIKTGAAKVALDAKDIKLKELEIEGGASSMDVTIGKLEEKVNVDITGAVSNITIKIPEDAYCELSTETILNNRRYKGFIKSNNGTYVTNAEKSNVSCWIYIDITAALSNIKIEKY